MPQKSAYESPSPLQQQCLLSSILVRHTHGLLFFKTVDHPKIGRFQDGLGGIDYSLFVVRINSASFSGLLLYAHGKSDFIAKLQIALKECYETEYWLELFVKSEILNKDLTIELYNQCGTIRRILVASINTAKENAK